MKLTVKQDRILRAFAVDPKHAILYGTSPRLAVTIRSLVGKGLVVALENQWGRDEWHATQTGLDLGRALQRARQEGWDAINVQARAVGADPLPESCRWEDPAPGPGLAPPR
jgi:hypothetical protein